MHICTSNPKIIRTEVENMRDDFNNRLTQILFSSFFSAYYACFLPLVFVQVCYYINIVNKYLTILSDIPIFLIIVNVALFHYLQKMVMYVFFYNKWWRACW